MIWFESPNATVGNIYDRWMTSDPHRYEGGWGYPPSEKVARKGYWITIPCKKKAHTDKERTGWNVSKTCHTSGRVGASQESSMFPTEDGDVDDVARGVAVLFPSRSSLRLCPLLAIREESASEDEDEGETVGSRAPGTETDVLSDTPSYGPGRVTADPSIQDMGDASRQLGSADDVTLPGAGACAFGTGDVFLGLSPLDGSQECPKMVIGQGATSDLTDLVDEAMCIVCLHGAEDEANVNEDKPSAVRWILETTTHLMCEMGERVQYPSGMHWLDCCHQPIHVTCMIRPFYRMEEWKCPHCRRTLASGLWGPIENVKSASLWPVSFQDVDTFVQSRLTLTDHELFHLMQAWDEEEDILIGR